MYCIKCGAETSEGDLFCAQCGNPVKTSSKRGKEAFKIGVDQPGGLDCYNGIRDHKKHLRQKYWYVGGSIAGVLGFAYFFYGTALLMASAVALVITAIVTLKINDWSEEEYYLLPGTRDHDGNHRCFFCGNKGIHRQGEYKTNRVEAKCSKCHTFLFTDEN